MYRIKTLPLFLYLLSCVTLQSLTESLNTAAHSHPQPPAAVVFSPRDIGSQGRYSAPPETPFVSSDVTSSARPVRRTGTKNRRATGAPRVRLTSHLSARSNCESGSGGGCRLSVQRHRKMFQIMNRTSDTNENADLSCNIILYHQRPL